jgi:hypothetical protein
MGNPGAMSGALSLHGASDFCRSPGSHTSPRRQIPVASVRPRWQRLDNLVGIVQTMNAVWLAAGLITLGAAIVTLHDILLVFFAGAVFAIPLRGATVICHRGCTCRPQSR